MCPSINMKCFIHWSEYSHGTFEVPLNQNKMSWKNFVCLFFTIKSEMVHPLHQILLWLADQPILMPPLCWVWRAPKEEPKPILLDYIRMRSDQPVRFRWNKWECLHRPLCVLFIKVNPSSHFYGTFENNISWPKCFTDVAIIKTQGMDDRDLVSHKLRKKHAF